MTEPYPDVGTTTPAEDRYLQSTVTPYPDADNDDMIACFIGSIGSGKYDARGQFVLTIEVPFDIVGNPTDMMRSQGMMLVWQARKL